MLLKGVAATVKLHFNNLFFIFCFRDGLKLLASSDSPTPASQAVF